MKLLVYLALVLTVPIASGFIGLAVADAFSTEFDSKTGYRIDRYRSPVPQTVPGGTRIPAADVDALVTKQNALLIDVMPSEGGRADPVTGAWFLLKKHANIPGSVWLADTGWGELTPRMETYFRGSIERLTAGDKSRPIIFYCLSDCWMSWNAVKRAASYGYTSLYWLSEGTDGWLDWGGKLVEAVPQAVPSADSQ